MLPPTIVCAACKRGSEGHDRFGKCVSLRRTEKRHGQLEALR